MSLAEFMTHVVTPTESSEQEAAYYAFYYECLNKAKENRDNGT